MNQQKEAFQPLGSKSDYLLIKELVGSAMYFSDFDEYALIVEDKIKNSSGWDKVRIVRFDGQKGCFVDRARSKGCSDSAGFYSADSQIIRQIKENTGTILRKFYGILQDPFERELQKSGCRLACLSPIILRKNFAGVIAGYMESDREAEIRDEKLLEVAAEIIALSLEIFHSKTKSYETGVQLKKIENRPSGIESAKIIGEIAAGTSHNLNNLLAAILGYIQLMSPDAKDQKTKDILNNIRNAALAGKETVGSLQEFRNIDPDGDFDVLLLGEIVKKAVNITKFKWQDEAWARNFQNKIEMDIPESLSVSGNRPALLAAFVIIMMKSLEYIPGGGKVTVEAFRESAETGFAYVRFVISRESGSPSKVSFDPFAHPVSSEEPLLDFKAAEEIIKKHGGTIKTGTEIGLRTAITVALPLAKIENQPPFKEACSVVEKSSVNILFVEDEPVLRTLLSDVLRSEGFNVITAENGENALDIIKTQNFDIVITDLGMPGMSGLDLADRIRKDNSEIPIIISTGWEARIDRKKVKEANVNHVIGKPFPIEELVEIILDSVAKYRK